MTQDDTKNQEDAADAKTSPWDKEKCQEQLQEYLDGWKRERAAFENYKKEEASRAQEMQLWTKRIFFAKLLPILDSFELALKHTPQEIQKEEWFLGYAYIKKQFDEILKNEGIELIEGKGQEFDPRFHEAVEIEGDGEKLIIQEELQKGYKIGDYVLRPARVKVQRTHNLQ